MTRTPYSHHSPEFKEQALLKARHRGTRSVISIVDEINMSAGMLRKWLQSASKKTGANAHPAPAATAVLDSPASAWSPAQRLMALQQSYALDDMARSGWCREHGVFEHQLRSGTRSFACRLPHARYLARFVTYSASTSSCSANWGSKPEPPIFPASA